jgi:hypothetical protein
VPLAVYIELSDDERSKVAMILCRVAGIVAVREGEGLGSKGANFCKLSPSDHFQNV